MNLKPGDYFATTFTGGYMARVVEPDEPKYYKIRYQRFSARERIETGYVPIDIELNARPLTDVEMLKARLIGL